MREARRVAGMVMIGAGLLLGVGRFARRRAPSLPPPPTAPAPVAAHSVESGYAGAIAYQPVPAAPLWAKSFYFDVALTWEKAPSTVKPRVATVPRLRRFQLLDKPAAATDDKPSFVMTEGLAVGALAPMSEQWLQHFGVGLSDADRATYLKTTFTAAFSFHGPIDAGFASLRDAMNGTRELADKTGALITDGSTRQVFSRSSFENRLGAWTAGVPTIGKHIAVHVYPRGALLRVVSLGMAKFGLPDLCVEETTRDDAQRMVDVVTLVAQTLVERGKPDRPGELDVDVDALAVKPDLGTFAPGATRKGTVTLAIGKPEEGDADNRLVEIVFPGSVSGVQQRQAQLLKTIFGAKDEMVQVDGNDPKIAAASARARAKLLLLKPQWAKGPPGLDHLIVKAPFTTPGGKPEWMWVEVTSWSGTKLRGILQNDAYLIPGLVAGTPVEVEETSIFDYMLRHVDGSLEGGETNALIEKGAKQ